jgi:hypothetical protein
MKIEVLLSLPKMTRGCALHLLYNSTSRNEQGKRMEEKTRWVPFAMPFCNEH